MKYLLTAITMSFVLAMQPAEVVIAQDIDANRMNRDLRIMENIIGELFKTQSGTPSRGNAGAYTFFSEVGGGRNHVKGTYLPGYGVIFDIHEPRNRIVMINGEEGNNVQTRFYYDSEGAQTEAGVAVSEDNVTRRMGEFLKDYGSTMGQLAEDERILLIYDAQKGGNRIRIRTNTGINNASTIDEIDQPDLPVISLSVKAKDLQEYRRGKLDADALEKRFEIATSEREEKLDLKVMGDIFESALRGNEGPNFRMMGRVSHLMLDNFGAIFSFDVRFSQRGGAGSSGLAPGVYAERLAREMMTARGRVTVEVKEESEESSDEENKIQESYQQLITNIKEYLVDYGRTLNSVDKDQYVLVSVSINGRYEDVPERLEIQVSKSVLEDMDRGKLSREKALEQVLVKEY